VILCSGKVYYDLAKKRDELQTQAVALVRLEQLYPWPEAQLQVVFGRYRRSRDWIWVQEESQNMGGWSFAEPRLRAMGFPFEFVGRDASASPATGSHRIHQREQELIVEGAFAVTPPGAIGPGFVGWVESNGAPKSETSKVKPGEPGA
jgi:2-oxoglutarate dehydrogenase E1 component